jgi:hypothetical protein
MGIADRHTTETEIRIFVDMRGANTTIKHTRHVTPTLNELITDLNGAQRFSKLDLRSGYHQLELHDESRPITIFTTHQGLFRYKRLNFGVTSAAEVFQHTIQTLLADIPNVRNVSDDIIIFGKSQAEHDQALHSTLERLHTKGMTLNLPKCKFNKDRLEFFGLVFSDQGVSPNPAKVSALKDAQPPTNVSELRSFLGMAQYSAHFIKGFADIMAMDTSASTGV